MDADIASPDCASCRPHSGNIAGMCPLALLCFSSFTACQRTLAFSSPPDLFTGAWGCTGLCPYLREMSAIAWRSGCHLRRERAASFWPACALCSWTCEVRGIICRAWAALRYPGSKRPSEQRIRGSSGSCCSWIWQRRLAARRSITNAASCASVAPLRNWRLSVSLAVSWSG